MSEHKIISAITGKASKIITDSLEIVNAVNGHVDEIVSNEGGLQYIKSAVTGKLLEVIDPPVVEGGSDIYECASVNTSNSTWTGYLWSQDASTKEWSKAETATAGLSYSYVTPVIGKSYTSDATVEITGFYEGGVPFELWQTWDNETLKNVNFIFTPTDDPNTHYSFSGQANGSTKVTGYIKPGTYYVGSSGGYSSGCDYSTDGGASWQYWQILFEQDNYHKFGTDFETPATFTVDAGMSKVCIRYAL